MMGQNCIQNNTLNAALGPKLCEFIVVPPPPSCLQPKDISTSFNFFLINRNKGRDSLKGQPGFYYTHSLDARPGMYPCP